MLSLIDLLDDICRLSECWIKVQRHIHEAIPPRTQRPMQQRWLLRINIIACRNAIGYLTTLVMLQQLYTSCQMHPTSSLWLHRVFPTSSAGYKWATYDHVIILQLSLRMKLCGAYLIIYLIISRSNSSCSILCCFRNISRNKFKWAFTIRLVNFMPIAFNNFTFTLQPLALCNAVWKLLVGVFSGAC